MVCFIQIKKRLGIMIRQTFLNANSNVCKINHCRKLQALICHEPICKEPKAILPIRSSLIQKVVITFTSDLTALKNEEYYHFFEKFLAGYYVFNSFDRIHIYANLGQVSLYNSCRLLDCNTRLSNLNFIAQQA